MIGTKALSLDLQISQTASVITTPDVVWSSGETWNGLTIERRRFDGKQEPDCQLSSYSLVLRLTSPAETEFKVKSNSQNQRSNRKNICFFSARAPKRICAHQQQEVIILTLSPEVINRAAAESRGRPNLELADCHQIYDAQLEHLIMALKAEAEAGYLSGRLYGESLCIALSTHLVTKYSTGRQTVCSLKGGMTPHSLRRVVEYIYANLSDDIRLSELAKVAGLSQHRFAHNFKETIGIAPHQFVIQERVERARRLLRETDLTVTTIAHSVGCGSPSRFTVLFRRATGATPSAYRASFK